MKESAYNLWVDRDETQYVFNVLSGKMVSLSTEKLKAVRTFLESGSTDRLQPHVLEGLVNARVLVGDDVDELKVLQGRWNIGRHDPRRIGITVVTSLGCNFDCPYCFEDKHPSLLTQEAQDGIVALLETNAERLNHFDVTWFGGEPLLGQRALFALSERLLEICRANDVHYSADIITNGWLLDGEMARRLVAHGVTTAQVTVDGPPDLHDQMRPHVNGQGTFERVVANLREASEHLQVRVRVSLDQRSGGRVTELFDLLVAEGLAGKVGVYPGRIIDYDHHPTAPSATYQTGCYSGPEFARAEQEFFALAAAKGLAGPVATPEPIHTPCTAVRGNEIIVGSEGELYKCWDDVGNRNETFGHISNYLDTDGRLHRWLAYDPFSNDECRSCIALPTCMGGCAHHAMIPSQYENRCGSFRYSYRETVERLVDEIEDRPIAPDPELVLLRPTGPAPTSTSTPVTLRPRRPAVTAR